MIFANNKKFRPAAALLSVLLCAPAFAQTPGAGSEGTVEQPASRPNDVQVFGGVRVWASTFDEPVTARVVSVDPATGAAVTRDVEQRFSSSKVAPIPFVGVRYRNFLASASYFARTAYDSKGVLNGDVRRDELDLNVGYYVLPQLALSVGYKMGKVDRVSTLASGGSKTEAIIVGASGSVPLETSARLSLYGNFAYGLARTKIDFTLPTGENKLDGIYTIGEVGLAYRLFSQPSGAVKGLSLSLGYRAQFLTLRNSPFGTYASPGSLTPVSVERKNIRATTDGFVLGLVGVF